ncbi:MAG: hypothetical protein AAGI90_03570 [Chlamydiota bacterium]
MQALVQRARQTIQASRAPSFDPSNLKGCSEKSVQEELDRIICLYQKKQTDSFLCLGLWVMTYTGLASNFIQRVTVLNQSTTGFQCSGPEPTQYQSDSMTNQEHLWGLGITSVFFVYAACITYYLNSMYNLRILTAKEME